MDTKTFEHKFVDPSVAKASRGAVIPNSRQIQVKPSQPSSFPNNRVTAQVTQHRILR